MHHALEIEEILNSIFHHYCSSRCDHKPDPTLAALARTCRAFKEPALDALWMNLYSLIPLLRCVPEASYKVPLLSWYSFRRSLTQIEWDILRSYARRIRCIRNFGDRLEYDVFEILSDPPTAEPLFPNLRHLHCEYNRVTMPLLNLPLPSLNRLVVFFQDTKLFQASVNSFAKFSPNLKNISFHIRDDSGVVEPNYISHWKNLSSVITSCKHAFDINDLTHLSHLPALTKLEFMLRATLPDPDSLLLFSNLRDLKLNSRSLTSVSHLISHSRLPAIMNFQAVIHDGPSRSSLASFFTSLLTSQAGQAMKELRLSHKYPRSDYVRSETILHGSDLQPLTAFNKLHHINLDVECNVCLADGDLLTLAATWPKLTALRINSGWGWNSQYGITPDGFVQLWHTCPSLNHVELRLDTRGYTQVPSSEALEKLRVGLTLPPSVTFNILDAAIEARSLLALASLFRVIVACCESKFYLRSGWDIGSSRMIKQLPNAPRYGGHFRGLTTRVYGPYLKYPEDEDETNEWLV